MAPSPPSRSYSTGLVKVGLPGGRGHYGSPAQYANGGPNADSSPKWPNPVRCQLRAVQSDHHTEVRKTYIAGLPVFQRVAVLAASLKAVAAALHRDRRGGGWTGGKLTPGPRCNCRGSPRPGSASGVGMRSIRAQARRAQARRRGASAALGLALVASLIGVGGQQAAVAATLPNGFSDTVVLSGLTNPTVLQFAADGRIFVGQKNGMIKVFASLTDTNPVTFADLSTNVQDFWDRGLLGLALDPAFPTNPYVYVLYTYDAAIGGTAPRWGDGCPTPPGATTDGCLVSARLSRLTASGSMMVGPEQVLIEDWCQQFPSHSIGTLLFGRDGMLYVSGGDGASFNNVDYGQYGASFAGDQANPCGDPPAPVGTALSPPTAEGGALRSQSVRRTDGPATLNGAILRVDPATGAGLPDNPFGTSPDANARRIVGYGVRNPFRITQRPGTDELWIGDVGWSTWEEINRLTSPTGSASRNFGWPCYEGSPIQSGYQGAGLNLCSSLYGTPGSVAAP